jgi:hypothetical protein
MKERRRGRIRKEQMRTRESESETYSPFLMRFVEGSVQRHEKEKEKEIKEKKKEKKSEEKPWPRKRKAPPLRLKSSMKDSNAVAAISHVSLCVRAL